MRTQHETQTVDAERLRELEEVVAQLRFSNEAADYRYSGECCAYVHPYPSDRPGHFDAVVQVSFGAAGASKSDRLDGWAVLLRRSEVPDATEGAHGTEWVDSGVTNRRGQIRFGRLPFGEYSACFQNWAAKRSEGASDVPEARRIVFGELGLVVTIDEGPAGRARVSATAGLALAGKVVRLTVGDETCHLALGRAGRGSDAAVQAVGLLEQSFAESIRCVARVAIVSGESIAASPNGPPAIARRVGLRRMAAVACAAGLLVVVVGGAFAAVRSAHVGAERDRANARVVELETQLTASRQARPIPPSPEDTFRNGFAEGRRFSLRTYPGRPGRISLVLDPYLQPPYYAGLEVAWNDHPAGQPAAPPQRAFWAGYVPLEPVVTRDFTARLPASGQERLTVELRFHATGEAMGKLGVPAMIVESVPLILSPQGVRVASVQDGERVLASIAGPADGQQVSDRFRLDFKVQRAGGSQPTAAAASPNMVHVLVRPLDGRAAWGQQYFVVPFRRRVDALPEEGERFEVWMSLSALLGLDAAPPDQRPSRFEVLVVELPFELQGWSTPKSVLNLDDPELATRVRARCELKTARPPADAAAAARAATGPAVSVVE